MMDDEKDNALSAADAAAMDAVLDGEGAAGPGDGAREKRVREWLGVVGRAAVPAGMGGAGAILLVVGFLSMGEIEKSKARTACAENMQKLATGFGVYAAGNAGQLPELTPPSNGNWLMNVSEVGARTNVMNLSPLMEK